MNRKPHVLFVCGRNQWRSPTAVRMYANDGRIEVRSAGVSPESRRQVTGRDLSWADLVLVMEPEHKERLLDRFQGLDLPPIDSLDIPDVYGLMNEELQELIREGTEFRLQCRFRIESGNR